MKVKWGSENFDWGDESLDEQLAKDWLANERLWRGRTSRTVPDGYDLDVDGWALELAQSDLDPIRGWRFILALVRLAQDEQDLQRVGIEPLETFLRNHGDAFVPEIENAAATDQRFMAALRSAYWPAGRAGEVIKRLVQGKPEGQW